MGDEVGGCRYTWEGLRRFRMCKRIVDGVGAKYMSVGDRVGIDYTGGERVAAGFTGHGLFSFFHLVL